MTVIGLVVAVPWLFIGVPVALLFGYVSVGALIGRLILGRGTTPGEVEVMLAAVHRRGDPQRVAVDPFAGSSSCSWQLLVGFGALFTLDWEWRRQRRSSRPRHRGLGTGRTSSHRQQPAAIPERTVRSRGYRPRMQEGRQPVERRAG